MPGVRLPIVEIFGPTLQGEGLAIGRRAMFVRLAGCDSRCPWCDTKYAWDPEGNQDFSPQEIAEIVQKGGCGLVVLTGGNPCIHDLGELVDMLSALDIEVHVETQGTVIPYWLSMVDVATICPKILEPEDLPRAVAAINAAMRRTAVQLKYVVFTERDYEDARRLAQIFPDLDLIIQPGYDCDSKCYPYGLEALARRVADDKFMSDGVRFLPQLHRIIWGDVRGV
jgi:7-carboxy-7-deazaguanine synthase